MSVDPANEDYSTCVASGAHAWPPLTGERIKELVDLIRTYQAPPMPTAVRLSAATFEDFCQRYGVEPAPPARENIVCPAIDGLRVVLDENIPFGKFKFEPDEPEAEPPSDGSLIRALRPDL